MNSIDKGIRATNYMIDGIVIYSVWVVLALFIHSLVDIVVVFYLIHFFYYFFMESFTQQTLGKMVTRTQVVNRHYQKANVMVIVVRSLSRLIPFDAMSYIFGTERGLHDVLSSTRLISTR